MHTQRQLLDMAAAKRAATYTGLAKELGVTRQALSQFKFGMPLSPELALKIAGILKLAPEYVVACVEYQRASRLDRTETLPVWKSIAEHFQQHSEDSATRMPPKAAKAKH